MEWAAPATFGILLLASFVGCFLASKRWHWAQVVLGEMVFLSVMLFSFLALDVIRLHKASRATLNSTEQNIERLEPVVRAITHGTRDSALVSQAEAQEVPVMMDPSPDNPDAMLSVEDLDHRLGLITRVVGRKWTDVAPQGAPAADTGEVTVKVEFPKPHGMEQNAVVYVFEQGAAELPDANRGPQGPQYLGEFRVTAVADDQVKLQPVATLDDFDKARLQRSRGPWIVYETMPVDQHPGDLLQLFTGKTADELKELMPPQVVDEYIRHGQPATPDDDEWHKVGLDADGNVVGVENWDKAVKFVYRRQLRDYSEAFRTYTQRWIELQAERALLVEDNKKLQTALTSAKALQAFREDEQAKLKHDLAGMTKDREAIEKHLAALGVSLANAQKLLTATLAENSQLVNQLAAAQQALTGGRVMSQPTTLPLQSPVLE